MTQASKRIERTDEQVAAWINDAIAANPAQGAPSVRALAEYLGVSTSSAWLRQKIIHARGLIPEPRTHRKE